MLARRPLLPASGAAPPGSPILWVQGDTGTFSDTIGGTPATTTGATVAAWQDLSGSGHHLAAGSGGQMQAGSGPNSHNFVRFAGTSQYLQALFTLDVPFDLFMMVRPNSWVSGANIAAGGVGDNFSFVQTNVTPQVACWTGVTLGANNNGLVLSTWALAECGMPSGTASYVKINNVAPTTGSSGGSLARAGLTLAAHPGPNNYANIDVAELILYASILNSTDATNLRAYFTSRYGIP